MSYLPYRSCVTAVCVCVCIELTFDRMTVGKIYAGLLIAENWKAFKANKGAGGDGSNTAVVGLATALCDCCRLARCSSHLCTVISNRRSQEYVFWEGEQCWICPILFGGRIEAPKAPLGVGRGEGVSFLHWRRSLGRDSAPFPENVLVFDLKMVNFGVF